MKVINFGTIRFELRPSCVATFATVYGIGKVKASRLNSYLLNHPSEKQFKGGLDRLYFTEMGRTLFTCLFVEKKVRLMVYKRLKNKIRIFCYQAFRMFQNLPTKGQRTKCNAGTPSRVNPYLALKLNRSFYDDAAIAYKKRELKHNGRFDELKAYTRSLVQKEKNKKADRKLKNKLTKQNYIKQQKLKS
jgi:ribosomal protein S13